MCIKEVFNWERSQRGPLITSRILPWQQRGSLSALHAPQKTHASFLGGSAMLPLALARLLSGTTCPAREIPASAAEAGGCLPKRHETQASWSHLKYG